MVRQGLKALFCERFKCPAADYEARALGRCLYWHARILAPVVRLLSSRFFEDDVQLIHELGLVTHWRDANSEIRTFQDSNRATRGWWRTGLRIRVSGRKVSELAQKLFSEERSQGGKG
jgi:hypothetical protein